jgi:NhaP-type Na+/H+ or K+/H+ antiporter
MTVVGHVAYQNLALIAGFLLFYSLFAGRFEKRLVNGPLMFLLAGMVLGPALMNLLHVSVTSQGLRLLAELTLAIVLFTDAANADLAVLRRNNHLPIRLLLLGLPLCLLGGYAAARILFPQMPWLEAAILAAMLAPTDAALGKAVVSNPGVPAPVRESLNVESGLNDGICVPVLFILLALLAPEEQHQGAVQLALTLILEEIGLGSLVGIVLVAVTGYLVRYAARHGWSLPLWKQLIAPGLAVLVFALAQALGGSGFIAAFIGGLLAGKLLQQHKHTYLYSNEGYSELLSVVLWVIFGAVVVPESWRYITMESWLYALASLTVLRMLPVWLSLTGSGLSTEHKLFIGWFGPRGLASIVFAVIVMQHTLECQSLLVTTVIATILLSVVLHGLTANPWVRRVASATGDKAE